MSGRGSASASQTHERSSPVDQWRFNAKLAEGTGGSLSGQQRTEAQASLHRLMGVLVALPESGESGFEGLVGALLGEVTLTSFRLAASGSQGGQDGRGDGPMGAVSFEAKLYRSKLTKAVVNNKATDIIASADPPDLWVLAATTSVTTQIIATLRAAFKRTETSLLVLDWPTNVNLSSRLSSPGSRRAR